MSAEATENPATANAMAVTECARWIHGVISYPREKSDTGRKNDKNRRNYDETMMKNVTVASKIFQLLQHGSIVGSHGI